MTDKQNFEKDINFPSKRLHGNRKDLTGLKVGKLTCLEPVKTGKNNHSEWLCECECGNFKIVQTYRLLAGRIQSCGDCYHSVNHYIPMIKELKEKLLHKEQECEELKQGYAELTEIVSPYMDDFTGYNEELGGFDIVLCVKQLLEQLDQLKAENRELKAVHSTNVALSDELFKYKAENEELKEKLTKSIFEDGKKQIALDIAIYERDKLKQTLAEIKEIIHFNKTNRLSGGAYISIENKSYKKLAR